MRPSPMDCFQLGQIEFYITGQYMMNINEERIKPRDNIVSNQEHLS